MKAKIIKFICMFTVINLLPAQLCKCSYFEMNLQQDAIYTPSKIHLTMKLSDRVKIEGHYQFKVSIYLAGTLTRRLTIDKLRNQAAIFEMDFPEVFAETDGRYHCELFIDGCFIEAQEKPLTLFPPAAEYESESIDNKEIWVFDISGRLNKLLADIDIDFTDATFQSARDFKTPDIVFIGQNIDPNNMLLIISRLKIIEPKPVVVFLKQKNFIKETKIEIPSEHNFSQNVDCDFNSPLLDGLNVPDIMSMLENTCFIKINKQQAKDRTAESCITEIREDKKNIYSYLCTIEDKGRITIYCQLPTGEADDPRHDVLLRNLLKYTDKISDSNTNNGRK